MALYGGIDPVAIATFGVYTETYGSGDTGNIANLHASFGYLEDAPDLSAVIDHKGWLYRMGMNPTLA